MFLADSWTLKLLCKSTVHVITKDEPSTYETRWGYDFTTLPVTIGQSGSWYHATSFAFAQIGIEHGPANKVMSKLHEHSVLTFHKIITSRRVLERENQMA